MLVEKIADRRLTSKQFIPHGHNPGSTSGGAEPPLFLGGIVTTFQGKDKVYSVETYRSGNNRNGFLDTGDRTLLDTVTDLYFRVYPDRNKGISVNRMMYSLSHPRTILELVRYGGVPVGYGIFPRLNIETEPKAGGGTVLEPVMYSSRAFLADHEGQGLGTKVLDEAIRMHRRELAKSGRELHWGALMTQTPLSLFTLEKLTAVETIYPFQKRYDENWEAQSLMLGVHKVVRMHSKGITTDTGVSQGELKELGMNDIWRPRPDAGRVWKIFQKMVSPEPKGLEMNREAGDVVYVLFRLRSSVDLAEMTTGR